MLFETTALAVVSVGVFAGVLVWYVAREVALDTTERTGAVIFTGSVIGSGVAADVGYGPLSIWFAALAILSVLVGIRIGTRLFVSEDQPQPDSATPND